MLLCYLYEVITGLHSRDYMIPLTFVRLFVTLYVYNYSYYYFYLILLVRRKVKGINIPLLLLLGTAPSAFAYIKIS